MSLQSLGRRQLNIVGMEEQDTGPFAGTSVGAGRNLRREGRSVRFIDDDQKTSVHGMLWKLGVTAVQTVWWLLVLLLTWTCTWTKRIGLVLAIAAVVLVIDRYDIAVTAVRLAWGQYTQQVGATVTSGTNRLLR